VIGITGYRQRGQTGVWDTEMAMLPGFYLEGIERAGGAPILIPPQPISAEGAREIVSRLDGLLISGGRDVESSHYGQQPHSQAEKPDTRRDHLEFALLAAALELGKPILGICRGAQVLNVHLGGTLHQHLPDVIGDNRYQPGGGNFALMQMSTVPGSKLHSLVGESVTGAVYHHQAIDQLGKGLRLSATSPDGIVQGVELENYPFALAVQWHPEQTLDDLRLFRALVAECG
jgi:putative glutamine amidotransferase